MQSCTYAHLVMLYGDLKLGVRSMVAYFHDNFIDDYDYLYLCGDDTYVIMENLKEDFQLKL